VTKVLLRRHALGEVFLPGNSEAIWIEKVAAKNHAFDLLSLDRADLRSRPLIERRKLLAKLLKNAPENIKISEELTGAKQELLRVAKQFQLKGLIAKRSDSLYEPGRRSGAWVKFKLARAQEFVIGGYTPPEGSRK
jgi:bifunctional non-homologous end joining protein LigD